MQSLAVFGRVDSRYTSVRCLDSSQLSKALISKKWHDWKYEIFTTAGSSNTEIQGFVCRGWSVAQQHKRKVRHVVFWTSLSRFSKYSVVAVILNMSSNFGIDSKEWVLHSFSLFWRKKRAFHISFAFVLTNYVGFVTSLTFLALYEIPL